MQRGFPSCHAEALASQARACCDVAFLCVSSGQYAAIFVAVLGALTSTLSLIGFCGLARESRLLLLLHALLLLVIALMLVAAAIMCFVSQK